MFFFSVVELLHIYLLDCGTASLNVIKIIRKELRPALQTAIFRAKNSGKSIKETVRIEKDREKRSIQICAKPFSTSINSNLFFLVILEETSTNNFSLTKDGDVTKKFKAKSALEQQIKNCCSRGFEFY